MTPASVQLQIRDSGERVITLVGDWTLASLRSSVTTVWKTLKSVAADPSLAWDLRRVEALDSTGALLIWRAWGGRRRTDALLRPEHESILRRVSEVPRVELPRWGRARVSPAPSWHEPVV